jgi:prepilin-type N-terminal cleavage/methylation domain-containing protein
VTPRGAAAPVRMAVAGFTLPEVMIAAVVLAVGLLALQALGVAAARATAGAARGTAELAGAITVMEEARGELARGRLAPALDCTLASGSRVVRSVSVEDGGTLARVEVHVVAARPGTTADTTYALSTHVLHPGGFRASHAAYACPE